MVTVFTPTYNRAKLLSKLYDSLKAQTSFDFEWLIVDDGSQDDTVAVVEGLLKSLIIFQSGIIYKKTTENTLQ